MLLVVEVGVWRDVEVVGVGDVVSPHALHTVQPPSSELPHTNGPPRSLHQGIQVYKSTHGNLLILPEVVMTPGRKRKLRSL